MAELRRAREIANAVARPEAAEGVRDGHPCCGPAPGRPPFGSVRSRPLLARLEHGDAIGEGVLRMWLVESLPRAGTPLVAAVFERGGGGGGV